MNMQDSSEEVIVESSEKKKRKKKKKKLGKKKNKKQKVVFIYCLFLLFAFDFCSLFCPLRSLLYTLADNGGHCDEETQKEEIEIVMQL